RCGAEDTLMRAAHASILRIDDRLVQIKERSEAVSLTGPLALTVTGSALAVGFGVATMIEWLMTTDLTNNPRDPNRARLIGLGAGALSGVALATGGLVWTIQRGGERRHIERTALPLQAHKRALELMVRPSASSSHAGLSLHGRF
ncbi:MAG TPA: hypothetical protein VFZ61_03445, partial [Polyangiales bacterium]